jgi:hypothetical protein
MFQPTAYPSRRVEQDHIGCPLRHPAEQLVD